MIHVPQYFAISHGFRQHSDGTWKSIGRVTVETLRTDSLNEAVGWVRARTREDLSVRLSCDRRLIIMKRAGETWLTNMLVNPADELADFAA